MSRKADETNDLSLVMELVFSGRGIELQRFDISETQTGRTPDFKVLHDGELVAYCEVKSPRDDWLDEKLDEAPVGDLAGGIRPDPTFNRIARHVAKAATQFDAVNGEHALPNILVFVNHAAATGYGDLRETLTGLFYTASGERIPTLMHIAEGRLGTARSKIDLYMWIDKRTSRVQGQLFNDTQPRHVAALCKFLGINEEDIGAP